MPSVISDDVVKKVAKLANLPLSSEKITTFSSQLEPILKHFKALDNTNTADTKPTSQVTGLKNITQEDVIDTNRMFTQSQALANAKQSQNGYFVTSATIHKNAS